MKDNKTVEAIIEVAKRAGYKVLSHDEFEQWWKEQEAYRIEHKEQIEVEKSLKCAYLMLWLDSHPNYLWYNGMREISGFGGSYELACRVMITAGLYWFDEHPDAEPVHKRLVGVTGITIPDNDPAKALEEAMVLPVKGMGVTGAMVDHCLSHCNYAHKIGWDKYKTEMEKLAEVAER